MSEWVEIAEHLPPKSGNYLVSDGEIVTELYLEKRRRINLWLEINGKSSEQIDDVTHWMYLPKPPKN